jgi:hypothetical protein
MLKVEDALMRAHKAILEDAQDTAEQSWTVYFDLEDSGSYVIQDSELFREEPGGAYSPVGRGRKRNTSNSCQSAIFIGPHLNSPLYFSKRTVMVRLRHKKWAIRL